MHPTEYLVHFSNVLMLVAYSVRDILWLRWFAVAAALTNIPYFLLQPTRLWPPVVWALVFTTINLYQIVAVAAARSWSVLVHELLASRRCPNTRFGAFWRPDNHLCGDPESTPSRIPPFALSYFGSLRVAHDVARRRFGGCRVPMVCPHTASFLRDRGSQGIVPRWVAR
jgi:hypothetical protein